MFFKGIVQLCDRLFAFAGALLFMQIPNFILLYQQQLKGHLDELQRYLAAFQKAADLSDKTLTQYIHKFMESGDQDFIKNGEIIQSMVTRGQELQQSLGALNQASLWERGWAFVRYLQVDIAQDTLEAYSSTIPLTAEGIVYGFFGLIAGYLVFRAIIKLFYGFGSLFRRRPKPVPIPVPIETRHKKEKNNEIFQK